MLLSKTLLHAQGLFETFVYNGYTRNLRRHIARLTNSSMELFDIRLKEEDFFKILPSLREGFVSKIVLETLGDDVFYKKPIEFRLTAYSKNPRPRLKYATLCISDFRRHTLDPTIYHKTTNYLMNTMSKQKALSRGFYDAIFLNEYGYVQETSAANILFVKGSNIYSPHPDDGFLMGTTLSIVQEYFNIHYKSIKNIEEFDACFILNSVIGAVPVINIEDIDFVINEDLQEALNICIDQDNLF